MPAFLHQLVSNLSALGAKRLAMLGGAAAAVIGLLALAAVLLNEPGRVVLYAGLDRDDVNAIAAALGEAGIEQWPGSDGGSVEVAAGSAAKARVILAERACRQAAMPATGCSTISARSGSLPSCRR